MPPGSSKKEDASKGMKTLFSFFGKKEPTEATKGRNQAKPPSTTTTTTPSKTKAAAATPKTVYKTPNGQTSAPTRTPPTEVSSAWETASVESPNDLVDHATSSKNESKQKGKLTVKKDNSENAASKKENRNTNNKRQALLEVHGEEAENIDDRDNNHNDKAANKSDKDGDTNGSRQQGKMAAKKDQEKVVSKKKETNKKRKAILEDSDDEDVNTDNNGNDDVNTQDEKQSATSDKAANNSDYKATKKDNFQKKNNAIASQPKKQKAQKSSGANTAVGKNTPSASTGTKTPSTATSTATVIAKLPPAKKPVTTGWGFLDGKGKDPPKKLGTNKKRRVGNDESDGKNSVLKAPYTGGEGLPILVQPADMFDDMVRTQLCKDGKNVNVLGGLLETMKARTLRVATMCSGTESPILALDMLAKSIEDVAREYNLVDTATEQPVLMLEHVFSCEIEPFKQAYIERNFQPKRLFRDIRELGSDQAHTAFGAMAPVPNIPGDVDILIAGTSCVDYSNLNNAKKELEQGGESGQTFMGMLKWIQKARPPIVILENVYGAPWNKKVEIFEQMGYDACFKRMDSKDYYIPHTRQRGYLFAVLRSEGSSGKKRKQDQNRLNGWLSLLEQLKRPASASLDAFLLPEDDPRVIRRRNQIGQDVESEAGRTDWEKCETRHQFARSNEELGEKRPLTEWSDSGMCTTPAFFWNDWVNAQVHRVHDLMDINTLRLAKEGVDNTYKTMIWNLSQNVDRDTMGKLGLSQCLTPTGIPYVTSRGGPMVGEELLLLQGIPADDLLLTRESDKQLKDLAGNAMSTTVVGSCILAALLQGHGALRDRQRNNDDKMVGEIVPSLVPRALIPASEVAITSDRGYTTSSVTLAPCGETSLRNLLLESALSARRCVTEGPDEAAEFLECKSCGTTLSPALAAQTNRYFEDHDFQKPNEADKRIQPASFKQRLLEQLPMSLSISIDSDLTKPDDMDNEKVWVAWADAVNQVRSSEFRFRQLTRSNIWIAHYESATAQEDGKPEYFSMQLRLYKTAATWFLFATPPAKKGPLRDAFLRPIAKCDINLASNSFMHGHWYLCLPVVSTVNIVIEPVGEKMESWNQKLGLKGKFASEMMFQKLKVTMESDARSEIKSTIDGVYQHLEGCGGACGSLMRKQGAQDIRFFLESGRTSLPTDDSYVFASTSHRLAYGEYRETILHCDAKYRNACVNDDVHGVDKTKLVKAMVPGRWMACQAQFVASNATLSVSIPTSLSVSLEPKGWQRCLEIVSCTIPLHARDKIFAQCKSGEMDLNLTKAARIFEGLAFCTSRLGIFSEGWMEMDRSGIAQIDGDDPICSVCAPQPPKIEWMPTEKGKTMEYKPIENPQQAAAYERALKERPTPWNVRLSTELLESTLKLQIACNAFSLAQRAAGGLPKVSFARKSIIALAPGASSIIYEWRVVRQVESVGEDFPKLTFTSNKYDNYAPQPPDFERYKLRPEQLRSLNWMLGQEQTTDPFWEEEVAEALLPSLGWRAEARVKRPTLVRGGIIADEVGYGKTAISLACISANPSPEINDMFVAGKLRTKATLVVVPGHLMNQWPNEIEKFLGKTKAVVVIKNMASFNKTCIDDILQADIVVVNFTVLKNDTYFSRLARFSGFDPNSIPSKEGRHFDDVYDEFVGRIPMRVKQMKEKSEKVFEYIQQDAEQCRSRRASTAGIRFDGKKAVYALGDDVASQPKAVARKPELKNAEIDPWGFSKSETKKSITRATSPPLELFDWHRVIMDEFTYTRKEDRQRVLSFVLKIQASYRWFLSGTPSHKNFNDIQFLAQLLGLHLGVDETLPGAKGDDKSKMDSERLAHFMEVRSLEWHVRRHKLAQAFLSRFVRQNIAEIDEIPSEEREISLKLPPVERVIYEELDAHLKALDVKSKITMSKKKSTGDKEQRMQKVLGYSKTAEEAKLKCCSSTNIQSLEELYIKRKDEKNAMEQSLVEAIAGAICQRNKILIEQPGWSSVVKIEKGELKDEMARYLKDVEDNASVLHGADDEVNDRLSYLVKMAEAEAKTSPTKYDEMFAKANSDVSEEIDIDEPCDDGDENDSHLQKKRKIEGKEKPKSDKQKKEMSEARRYSMKKALRDHCHTLRQLGKELCGRVRSLRFLEQVRNFQNDSVKLQCSSCQTNDLDLANAGVLSCCGHVGCLTCLKSCASGGNCIESPSCSARVNHAYIVTATKLVKRGKGVNGKEEAGTLGDTVDDDSKSREQQLGTKISSIVTTVKNIIDKKERMIIFCQFDDLKEQVGDALTLQGVDAVQVKGSVEKQIKALAPFQKEKADKNDPHVLLLKMDDEQSAGLNLTCLNHAIFVHPLLAGSQQEYDAYETQAIGRIRRYGQTRTVHVWRFLAEDTIDTEIFEKHSGRALSDTTNTT